MAEFTRDLFDSYCEKICSCFGFESLNIFQKEALMALVLQRRDTFINLPTGFGKSLVYQALPLFRELSQDLSPIIIVVSPLISLMKDQVSFLKSIGIKATSLNLAEDEGSRRDIEKGLFSVVYGSPESWLTERWRNMLKNPTYSRNICAVALDEAHIINHW